MKVSQAIQSFREYHRLNSKKNTLKNDEIIFTGFKDAYGDRQIDTMKPRNRIMLELMARGGMRVGEVWIENLYG
jgi:site-specific recombinase XerD